MSEEKVREFLTAGSEIAGPVSAAAIGLMVGGPGGALAGAGVARVLTTVFKRTCMEIYDRVAAPREKIRAGAAAAYALTRISERLKSGHSLRDDKFFDAEVDRSSADEILEGIILKSRSAHEERKCRFIANIFVTIAFDPRFTPESVNHTLLVAERLTYRQLCLLHLFSDPQPLQLRDKDFRGEKGKNLDWETVSVLDEIYGLYQNSLVRCCKPGAKIGEALLGMSDIYPSWMVRTVPGNRLHYLMDLQLVDKNDLIDAAKHLMK